MASKHFQDKESFTAEVRYKNGDASAPFPSIRDEDEPEEPYTFDLTLWPNTEIEISYSDGRREKLVL